jgi:hypothetical protein
MTHAGIMENLNPILANEKRKEVTKAINKDIGDIARDSSRRLKDQRIESKKKAAEARAAAAKIKELTKSDPGYPGHSYKAKGSNAPKSKNKGKTNFEDARLATRLCSALQIVPTLTCTNFPLSFVILKSKSFHRMSEGNRPLVTVKPGMKVSHYSMTASELMGKADRTTWPRRGSM